MRSRIRLCCAAALLAVLVAQPAAAQSQPVPSPAVRTACAADVRALCPGVRPGGGRILQCMREKRESVSEACREALAAKFQSQSQK
jgi:hypothetical protein